LHTSTIAHELRELSKLLLLREDLEKERNAIQVMTDEELDLKAMEVIDLVGSLQSKLLDVQRSHKDKSDVHKELFSALEENYPSILKSSFGRTMDTFSENPKFMSVVTEMEGLRDKLSPSLKWYRSLVSGASEVLLKQDRSGNIAEALIIASSDGFSVNSCEAALEALSQNIYYPKSFKVAHLSDLRKALAANERRLSTLEFLQNRLMDYEPEVGQLDVQANGGIMFESCVLYVLADLSKLAHQHRNGMGIKGDMDAVFGDDWHIVYESLEILHESDLLQSPESSSPDFDLTTVLVSSSIASILYLHESYRIKQRKTLLQETTIDQLQYFERIHFAYNRFTILLAKEILPKCIKASFGKKSMIFSLMGKLDEFRKSSQEALLLENEKLLHKADELMASFEDLETEYSTDPTCLGILESIQNIIQEIQNVKMKFVTRSSKRITFLKLMIQLGTMIQDGKEFIVKSSLPLADPTGEYANIVDISQVILQVEFKKTRMEFTSFMDYLREEFYYKPYFAVVQCIIEYITTKLTKRYTKGWNTNPKFQENTQIPWVDLANKYLNCFVRLGTVPFDKLVSLKQFAVKNGLSDLIRSIRSKTESKVEFLTKSIESQQASLEKYQLLHGTDLFDDNSAIAQFHKRADFLQSLENGMTQLVRLNSSLDQYLESETEADIVALLTEQKHLNLELHEFCDRLFDYEDERLPNEQMVIFTMGITQDLEHLYKLKRRFGSFEGKYSKEVILEGIEKELSDIHTQEAIKVLKQLLKKLTVFFDSLKLMIDPIMRIADSVVTNAKNTPFNAEVQKRMMVCMINKSNKKQWKALRELLKQFHTKLIRFSKVPLVDHVSELEADVQTISQQGVQLMDEILNYGDLDEVVPEPEEETEPDLLSENTNTTLRTNKGQSKNVTALNALKQIRSKLEGRDTADRSRQTIPEQVHNLIMQATSPERLAVMYEGWMSWI
jgi:DNA-dependent RNA polymerase auxiliary subunit epsilon